MIYRLYQDFRDPAKLIFSLRETGIQLVSKFLQKLMQVSTSNDRLRVK